MVPRWPWRRPRATSKLRPNPLNPLRCADAMRWFQPCHILPPLPPLPGYRTASSASSTKGSGAKSSKEFKGKTAEKAAQLRKEGRRVEWGHGASGHALSMSKASNHRQFSQDNVMCSRSSFNSTFTLSSRFTFNLTTLSESSPSLRTRSYCRSFTCQCMHPPRVSCMRWTWTLTCKCGQQAQCITRVADLVAGGSTSQTLQILWQGQDFQTLCWREYWMLDAIEPLSGFIAARVGIKCADFRAGVTCGTRLSDTAEIAECWANVLSHFAFR